MISDEKALDGRYQLKSDEQILCDLIDGIKIRFARLYIVWSPSISCVMQIREDGRKIELYCKLMKRKMKWIYELIENSQKFFL